MINIGKIQYTGGMSELPVSTPKVSVESMEELFHSKFKDTLEEAKRIGEKRRKQLASINDSQILSIKLR